MYILYGFFFLYVCLFLYWVYLDFLSIFTLNGIQLNNLVIVLQTVNLSFEFPYYGHLLREITVTTGGEFLTRS